MIETTPRTLQILGGPMLVGKLTVLQSMVQQAIRDIVELRKGLPTASDEAAALQRIALQAEFLADLLAAEDAWLTDVEAERANEIESLCRLIDDLERDEG